MTQVAADVVTYGLAGTASVSLLLSIVLILTARDAVVHALWFLLGLALGLAGVGLVVAAMGDLLALLALYVLVASLSVWLILAAYIISGSRGTSLITAMKNWLIEHAHPLAFALSLAFGLLFTGQALIALLA